MTAFHDVLFPLSLAFGATGGPSRSVEVTALSNGAEHRNAPHAHSRRRYNAATGIKSTDDMATLIAFFEARLGRLHSFRFRDPMDYRADNSLIATANGRDTRFALVKNYGDSAGQYARPITLPRADSLSVSVGGYTLEPHTGVLIFDMPPAAGTEIFASFDFDVKVRFDTDGLELSLEAFGAGQVGSVPLIEVFDHA